MENLSMDVFSSEMLDNIITPENEEFFEQVAPKEEPEEKPVKVENTEGDVIPKETKEVTPSPPSSKNTDKKSPLSSFAKLLEERGYFTLPEDKNIESFDDIDELLNETIRQKEFAQLTPKQKQILEWVEGGVPDEVIIQHETFQRSIESITDEVIEDESDQGVEIRRGLLTRLYELKGFSPEKIAKSIKRIEDSGEDVEEAKDARKELAEIEQQNFKKKQEDYTKQLEEEETKAKKSVEQLQTFLKTTKEIIPGLTIPQKVKDELFNGFTKPVSYKQVVGNDGKPYNKPLNIIEDFLANASVEDLTKLGYYIKLTDKFTKHDVLSTKKAKSDVEKEFETAIRSSDIKEYQKVGVEDPNWLNSIMDNIDY